MNLLIVLIVLLVLAIVFFVTYPILKRKIVNKKYSTFCSKKIKAIYTEEANLKCDIDCGNNRIIPGIFDTHNHGGFGYDMIRATSKQDIKKAEAELNKVQIDDENIKHQEKQFILSHNSK